MRDAKPGTFTLERSATIAAPADKIAPLIFDLHAWESWSPWDNVPGDNLAKTYSGAERGVGAVYEWTGKRTGQGRMEVTGVKPDLIEIDLKFFKPYKADNITRFRLTPTSGGTEVTWTMSGKTTFMSKAMGLVMNMDKMVGGSFEKGLAKLKTIAEESTTIRSARAIHE